MQPQEAASQRGVPSLSAAGRDPENKQGQASVIKLGVPGAGVRSLPLVRIVQALGQRLSTAPGTAALERSPRPTRAARGQLRVGRSGPPPLARLGGPAPLPLPRMGG